jgi:UDP-glucose 4-epimerase
MANWVVTGGCGFIGSALVRALSEQGGHAIRVVDNLSVGSPAALEGLDVRLQAKATDSAWETGCIYLHPDDILDAQAAIKLVAGADVIVHLAANTGVAPSVEDPRMDCVTNVIGTLNYLEAARQHGVKRFIFASSGAPVGEVTPPIHEEIVPHPVSPYGASKLCGEAYCSAYFKTYGIETVALRFGNVYGPGSAHKSSVVAKFISTLMAGKPLTIYGDGSQTRDFIYLFDLLDAIKAAAHTENIGGEVFQIATSQERTVAEVAQSVLALATEAGLPSVTLTHAKTRQGDVARNYSDTSKAKQYLGWQASTPFKTGLARTFDWFITRQVGA